jgi:hypothetical protein
MLSEAKHLAADRDRPFAEFTLSEANGLRVTWCDCANDQGLFFTIEPCLKFIIAVPRYIGDLRKLVRLSNSPNLSSSSIKPGSALATSKVAWAFLGISSKPLFGIFALEAELL